MMKRARWIAVGLVALSAGAQTCTTQARMVPGTYAELGDAALAIVTAIKDNDGAAVQNLSVPELTANFAPTAYVVRTTGEALAGDTLKVTQRYELDANAAAETTSDTGSVSFSCPLKDSASEVDFSISGLSKGLYGFVLVEAVGDRPWVVSLLLRQDGGVWKMAGLYPHARTAAGHDGRWFWEDARAKAKAGQSWMAWVEFGVADQLLSPVGFMATTGLDKLRAERTAAAPAALRDGLSAQTPLMVKGAGDASFAVTELGAEGAEDGKQLNLVVLYRAEAMADPVAARARNVAAVKALVAAYPELRAGVDGALVTAEVAGASPFPTLLSKGEF